jgi:hypothetical protein
MTTLTIQFPATEFPAGGGTVAFPPVAITADDVAELLGFASAAALTAAVTAAPTVAKTGTGPVDTNTYPLAVPATPGGANVSVGTGASQIDVYIANTPGNTVPAQFSVGVTPDQTAYPGAATVVVTQPFTVTSNNGESQGAAQVLTIKGAFGASPTIYIYPEGNGINGMWCWLNYNLMPFQANADADNSRGTGTPVYGTMIFDSNANQIEWLSPSVIPAVPVAPPAATLSTITGATINGTVAAADTLANLIAATPTAGTLVLPAGTFVGTAAIPNQCTITGAGMGKTIIDCTGLTPNQSKAVLVPSVPGIVIQDLTVQGAAIAAALGMNAAGVRDSGPGIGFTLIRVESTGNQNGLLTFGSIIVVSGSNIHDNGSASLANGQAATHEIYVGGGPGSSLTISDTTVSTGPLATHAVKSRALGTVISGSALTAGCADGNVSGSVVDIPDGGLYTMTGGSLNLNAGASNTLLYGYAMESATNLAAGVASSLSGVVCNGGGQGCEIQNGSYIPTATLVLTSVTADGAIPAISGFASVTGAIVAAA